MIILILAPYATYAALMLVVSAKASLMAATAISAVVMALDAVRGRSMKLLGAGTIVLFAALIGYLHLVDPTMSTTAVKLAVDGGMFVISAGSILIRRPFTLQYAIEAVPAEIAGMPDFLHANDVITGAWAAATLLMLLGNVVMIYVPGLPFWTGLAVAFAARNSAIYFTTWYPQYRRLKSTSRMAGLAPAAK